MDDIAQRIQSRMEALELSARSLSLKAGLSERHVGKILERGSGGGAEGNTLGGSLVRPYRKKHRGY